MMGGVDEQKERVPYQMVLVGITQHAVGHIELGNVLS